MGEPSQRTQKVYILRHASLFDPRTARLIMQSALAALQPSGPGITPGQDSSGPFVDLDLDEFGRSQPSLLHRLYCITQTRVRALSVPCGAPGSAPAPGCADAFQ